MSCRQPSDLVAASLAATLWRTLAGVNVVLQVARALPPGQVYHDSPLPAGDSSLLDTLTETGVEVKVHEVGGPWWPGGQVGTSGLADSDPCDCALQAALAPALLSSAIHLKEEDIVMTAEVPDPL